jgi:PTS system glucitol/sorbitol-specific IIC component
MHGLMPITDAAGWFIGLFQAGGKVFVAYVVGIIPTLVVLLTAFYALAALVGEDRIHNFARFAGKYAFRRYTLLPLLSRLFLTNPMAYTFGVFLEEKHKPTFYDAAVSYCHPITALFPNANAGELFVYTIALERPASPAMASPFETTAAAPIPMGGGGFTGFIAQIGRFMGRVVGILFASGRKSIDQVIRNILPFIAFVTMLVGIIDATGLGKVIA